MQGLPWTDLDYCCYCNWGYRKRTRLWSNVSFPGKLCPGKGNRPNMDQGKHRTTAQQGKNRCKTGLHGTHFTQKSLHKVPPNLCNDILQFCTCLCEAPPL
jgi:hypothetical protein